MRYLNSDAVTNAIRVLNERVHPFVGITFLACKAFGLRVGEEEEISVDTLTNEHLFRFHKLDKRTDYFFQPFKSVSTWVSPRYASTGLQTANTQTFASVFLHKKRSRNWGFSSDYVNQIIRILSESGFPTRIPSGPLAVWLYKDVEFGDAIDYRMLIELFYQQFNIEDEEKNQLFQQHQTDDRLLGETVFSDRPLNIRSVLQQFPEPPGVEREPSGILGFLKIENTELAPCLEIEFGNRLTLITGDNGLGKSFLLEFAWWVTTGTWAHRPAFPHVSGVVGTPRVEYELKESSGRKALGAFAFDFGHNAWSARSSVPMVAALCLFARADGSFAVFDPVRNKLQTISGENVGRLTSDEVWDGRPGLIEGLIRDWVRWQQDDESISFTRFCDVLRHLSPQDLGELKPGLPIRMPGDPA